MSNALPARDQSMDDILASIRRIIETGDERLAQNTSALDAASYSAGESLRTGTDGRASDGYPSESAISMPGMADQQSDLAGVGHRAVHLAAGGSPDAKDAAELSALASDASRVSANAPRSIRRAAGIVDGELPEWPQAIAANDRYVEVAAEMFVDEFDEAGFAEELLKTATAAEAAAHADFVSRATEDSGDGEGHIDDLTRLRLAGFELPESETAVASIDDDIRVAHALVSQESGERVAASFSELAAAIRDEHLRDADQIVREVMRPMLQEWLDENLPRLVEQLVREEIERVARGGKR